MALVNLLVRGEKNGQTASTLSYTTHNALLPLFGPTVPVSPMISRLRQTIRVLDGDERAHMVGVFDGR